MTTDEHLDLIVSRCRELLALAEKRTQGEWKFSFDTGGFPCAINQDNVKTVTTDPSCTGFGQRETDTQFIAACAGNAEAGWRSTIVAIELLKMLDICGGFSTDKEVQETIQSILAAWPIELLTKQQ